MAESPSSRRARKTSSRSSRTAGGRASSTRPRIAKLPSGLPRLVYAQASPRSQGGVSMFAMDSVDAVGAGGVQSETSIVLAAAERLQSAGFQVLQSSTTTINIAAAPGLYERAFGVDLVADERPVRKEQGKEDTATFVECPQTDKPGLIDTAGTDFSDVLEGVALEEPRYFMTDAFAPKVAYWHLEVPGDVAAACNAERAHRRGITGRGVRVVMTDTGHYAHPFFAARGYRVRPVVLGPGAANPVADEVGHGTAESANIFAVAPDADFTMVKMSFVNSVGAFNTAVALAPHVISNSWGSDKRTGPLSAADNALAAAIAVATAGGILVVFSAGNGHFGFPGQHPDVLSAGGTFMTSDGALRASDYASGFASEIYAGRSVPDLCGLVGMRPRAAYIMLPVQPGDDIDRDLGNGRAHPDGDMTPPDDGWAAISGTSAAAPQLAGVAALVRQACPRLDPRAVRDLMVRTAVDVRAGRCFNRPGMNHAATTGPDLATGTGLVNADRAALLAQLRCLLRPARPGGGPLATGAGAGDLLETAEGVPMTEQDVEQLESLLLELGPDAAG
jgi:subtilisin family serine protease